MYRRSYNVNPLLAILFVIGFFVLMYYFIMGFFYVIYWAAPLIVLGVLILDYRLFVDHFKGLFQRIKREPVSGILWFIVNILALPLVALWLLIVGLAKRKVKKAHKEQQKRRDALYSDYELVDEEEEDNSDNYFRLER